MKKRIPIEMSEELVAELDHICQVTGKDRTAVVRGMVEHWGAVIRDHEARGFLVRPLPDRSLACAMVGDRAGMFDELAPGRPTPETAMVATNISMEIKAPVGS